MKFNWDVEGRFLLVGALTILTVWVLYLFLTRRSRRPIRRRRLKENNILANEVEALLHEAQINNNGDLEVVHRPKTDDYIDSEDSTKE